MKTKFYVFCAILMACMLGMSACSSSDVIIEATVQSFNKQCPLDLGNGLTAIKMENDSRYVVYYYKGDDDIYSFSNDLITDAQKEQTIQALQTQSQMDDNVKKFIRNLKKSNKGICYHYFTSTTTMDLIIEAHELRE